MKAVNIDVILDGALGVIKADPAMVGVTGWQKINGIIPGRKPTISIGCDEEAYEEYTRDMDKGTARIKIFASLDNRELPAGGRQRDEDRLAYGERAIRRFAENIRQVLIENVLLGGIVAASFPRKIEYLSADGHDDLHIAAIHLEVDFFAPRKRRSPITVNEIDAIHDGERKIVLKGESK